MSTRKINWEYAANSVAKAFVVLSVGTLLMLAVRVVLARTIMR